MNQEQTIYGYTDYRRFLKKRFLELKRKHRGFSYRVFCKKAGLKNSGFLKLVIDGKKNLGVEGIRKFIRGFDLEGRQARYFEMLVYFNQASTHEEKEHYFSRLVQFRGFQIAKRIAAAQYNIFSHWYYIAILEIIRMETRETRDARWVQAHLKPEVSYREVKKAVCELLALGMIEEEASGNLVRKDVMLSTEDEVTSMALSAFHLQMSDLAKLSIQKDLQSDREFSSLTIATSQKGYQQAKKEVQLFRKKIHDIMEKEVTQPKSFVGHLNFQLFKLSK